MINVENVRRDYNSLYDIVENMIDNYKNVESIRSFANGYGLTVEIGVNDECGENCFNYKFDNMDIDELSWIRIETFGNLGYIYFHTYIENNILKIGDVSFDLYDEDNIISDATIDNFELLLDNIENDY